ncbi:hypothetical protein TbgDal_X620 [Trypanosoma brucei gambiense DAL972]|uniref:Uncharacterized protein n=1 Tax=Trypanosoma brucei gambiense (strain MHOM/CI/86/DAL972) TaxID=679716 RepID=D0A139_TRYB9|nr:hypothetical protein TbgDal_X620 [Trypanosoma brucei gambiense DAL972]CBH14981.1 hypothetical protein TbgDal_X620 [Trypanosoma brucei gambiense DAL972]|eukprot:XP_011777247.1 hypothetical protein TbgDal_X620 [Trypanosoma brucei gambiense DAL972]
MQLRCFLRLGVGVIYFLIIIIIIIIIYLAFITCQTRRYVSHFPLAKMSVYFLLHMFPYPLFFCYLTFTHLIYCYNVAAPSPRLFVYFYFCSSSGCCCSVMSFIFKYFQRGASGFCQRLYMKYNVLYCIERERVVLALMHFTIAILFHSSHRQSDS